MADSVSDTGSQSVSRIDVSEPLMYGRILSTAGAQYLTILDLVGNITEKQHALVSRKEGSRAVQLHENIPVLGVFFSGEPGSFGRSITNE